MATDENGAAATDRLCTQRRLDEMCRTGVERVHEAIDSGDGGRAGAAATAVQSARCGLAELFTSWSAASLAYLLERHGEAAMAAALDPEQWLALGVSLGPTPDEAVLAKRLMTDPTLPGTRIAELVDAGDPEGAKAHWDEVEAATLKLHDHRIDWTSEILSHVYRGYGPDGVEGALAHAAAQPWWRDRMTADLALDPVERITQWSFFLGVGNFGAVSVTEQEECFVIHHQVCGSCARQQLNHRHDAPWSLARVAEPVPALNFGIEDYTIYRTHLAAWHFVMPIGQGLPPWPAVDCSGVPGRCWFTIYKDPARTPDRYWELVGARPPARV
jgi:hypothetical protein